MADFQSKIDAVRAFIRRFPVLAGAIATEHFDASFTNRGFTDQRLELWKPVVDRKGNIKERPLVKSGRLRASIHAVEDGHAVEIRAEAPYARIHNEGGKVSATANVRSHSRRVPGGKAVTVRAHSRVVNFTMPKRQYIGHSRELNAKIKAMITEELNRILP